MLALPTGIKELTKFILKEEYKRDKKNIIVYNLVASYSYAPKRLIDISCSILEINDENLPRYFYEVYSKYYHLHSWYRETLENLNIEEIVVNPDNLPNLSGLKDTLEEVNKHLGYIEDDRLNEVKNDLNQFLDSIKLGVSFNDNLGGITDALLLASLIRYSFTYLKAKGQKYGYNIIRDDIDPHSIERCTFNLNGPIEYYYEISVFALTQLFSNVTEEDFKERSILPLIVLYSSRFYENGFSLIIRKLISGKKPDINEDLLLNLVAHEQYPFINYIHATSYWLRYANLINYLTNGGFFILIGKFEDAVKEYDKAIKLNPNEPDYHSNKGIALFELGRYQEALDELIKSIKLRKNDPHNHNNRGNVLSKLGKKEEALAEYDKAIKLNPNNPYYHSDKGSMLYILERKEEALNEFEKARILSKQS